MSYIPLSLNTSERDTRCEYNYALPLNGVSFSMNEADFEEGKCRLMENFDINTNSLSNVGASVGMFEDFATEKTLYSITKDGFNGKIIAHIGNKLYMFDENSAQPDVLSDILPDKQSVFAEFLSKLYIYCDRHVFCVDTDFVFKEEECDAPVLYNDIIPGYGAFTTAVQNDVSLNLIAPRIAIEYVKGKVESYPLPYKCDLTRNVEVLVEGEVYPSDKYIVYENRVLFSDYTKICEKKVKISYYVANDDDIGFEDSFSSCSVCEVFGGNNLSGTRIFMTGNPDKKGVYYKSELLNPLFFSEDDYEIVGDGCDNVTGLIKMYDSMIILTERAVYAMAYVLSEPLPYFSIKMLSNQVGCDMPKSIALVDNRVVFANSNKGIFILDSANEAGEHNVKPISKNIERNGNTGFFDCNVDDLRNACSIDFERKYILCVKNRAYIWDYGKSPYSESSNYSKAQTRLIFTLRDFEDADYLFNLSGKLCSCSKENIRFKQYSKTNFDTRWKLLSGKMSFNLLGSQKCITDMSIVLKKAQNTNITLKLFSDNTQYYTQTVKCNGDLIENVKLKLPSKKLSFFEFELEGSGSIEIHSIILKYRIL